MSLENCNIAASLSTWVLHRTRAGQSGFWSVWTSSDEQDLSGTLLQKQSRAVLWSSFQGKNDPHSAHG